MSATLYDDRYGDLTPDPTGGWKDEFGGLHAECEGCGAPCSQGDHSYCGGEDGRSCDEIWGFTHQLDAGSNLR